MRTFESLIEEYYQNLLMYGQKEAMQWLDDVLYTQDARDAVKDFVLRSMKEAEALMNDPDALEDIKKQLPKKNKEIH